MLTGKKILVGVTGSIAAYKAAFLIRLLKKQGAEVQVIMTASASDFITPLTLSTLSENPALSAFVKDQTGTWNSHVELGLWADVMLIAPASANTLSKMAHGLCDNLLLAVYLSARCPVMIAPAMDLDMFAHPSTTANLQKLESYGNYIIDAESGELASGLTGKGRMAEPEHIVAHLHQFFDEKPRPLQGVKALVTAGPTHEHIDPVRFIGNGSTGKMGIAIANALANKGASVTLVSGPIQATPQIQGIEQVNVVTAEEMYQATLQVFPQNDIAVFTAAVADYTTENPSPVKIKKNSDILDIRMVKTKDIAAEMGKIKQSQQLTVGFALETDNEMEHARKKLTNKNFDFIVLNSLQDKGAGFAHDTNQITMLDHNGVQRFELKSKTKVAEDVVGKIVELFSLKKQS